MLQRFWNLAVRNTSGKFEIPHSDIKQKFGIPYDYQTTPLWPSELLNGYFDIPSTGYEGKPCGSLYSDPDNTVVAKYALHEQTINRSAQAVFQYYDDGIFRKKPRLAILIVDRVDVTDTVLRGEELSVATYHDLPILDSVIYEPWGKKSPVKFAMIADVDSTMPTHEMLNIRNIRVNGTDISLQNEADVQNMLDYGASLFQKILDANTAKTQPALKPTAAPA